MTSDGSKMFVMSEICLRRCNLLHIIKSFLDSIHREMRPLSITTHSSFSVAKHDKRDAPIWGDEEQRA